MRVFVLTGGAASQHHLVDWKQIESHWAAAQMSLGSSRPTSAGARRVAEYCWVPPLPKHHDGPPKQTSEPEKEVGMPSVCVGDTVLLLSRSCNGQDEKWAKVNGEETKEFDFQRQSLDINMTLLVRASRLQFLEIFCWRWDPSSSAMRWDHFEAPWDRVMHCTDSCIEERTWDFENFSGWNLTFLWEKRTMFCTLHAQSSRGPVESRLNNHKWSQVVLLVSCREKMMRKWKNVCQLLENGIAYQLISPFGPSNSFGETVFA